MGLYFEDFETSADLVSRGRTITDADVMAFAGLTGDFTELHTNEEFAKTTRFGRRIAHGALVFSIAMGLATRTNILDDTLIAFAGVDKLRFVEPVFIGDTIHPRQARCRAEGHGRRAGDRRSSRVARAEPAARSSSRLPRSAARQEQPAETSG